MSYLSDVQDKLPKLSMVVTPPSEENLRLAAQMGVEHIVGRYPGPGAQKLRSLHDRIEEAGLRLSVIEGYLPMQRVVTGSPGREEDMAELRVLLEAMGELEIPVLCYNFMQSLDMTRTRFNIAERGGALVNAFDATGVPEAPAKGPEHEQLWENLRRFLEEIVPIAEANGVKMAMHPDDPPMPKLGGESFIMFEPESFERLVTLVDSPSNSVCFCQGCFAEMDANIPATIRLLGDRIAYVHFRDVKGRVPSFQESFHDNGKTDMYEAMRAYRDIGFTGPMRPDHVPAMEGEKGEATGYTMQGRLFAVGYMKGLMEGVAHELRQGN